MKSKAIYAGIVLLFACGQPNTTDTPPITAPDTTIVVSLPTLAPSREVVKTKAVAYYEKKVPNDLNDWRFSVSIFETNNRQDFLIKMQYQEITGKDTINIPNLGIEPTVLLKPGSTTYSCIIGFLDKKGDFKPYKEVIAKNDNLKITTLKYYSTSAVRVK